MTHGEHGCRTIPLRMLCDTMRTMYRLIMDEIGLGYRPVGTFQRYHPFDQSGRSGFAVVRVSWWRKRFQLDFACDNA